MTNGILPFGSGDPSVVIEHSLTSEPTNGQMNATSNLNVLTGITFDPVMGVKLGASATLRYLTISGLSGILTTGGQISIEVERDWCCIDDATAGSIGYAPVGEEIPFSLSSGSGGDVIDAARKSNAGSGNPLHVRLRGSINGSDIAESIENVITGQSPDVNGCVVLSSIGKGSFVKLTTNIVPNGLDFDFFTCIDGVPMAKGTITADTLDPAGIFSNLWIGQRLGVSRLEDHFIRNLTISDEPADFVSTKSYMFWGDSQVRPATMQNGGTGAATDAYDNSQIWVFLRSAAENGLHIDPSSVFDPEALAGGTATRVPGALIADSGGTNLAATRTAVLAQNPDVIFFIAGTNDSIALTFPSDFQTSLDGHVSAMNASTANNIVVVNARSFVGNTTNNTSQSRTQRDGTVNPALRAITANYVDAYNILGAESPGSFTFLGQYAAGHGSPGLNADLHLASSGGFLEGGQYFSALFLAAPTLTTLYSDLINLNTDVVSEDLKTNISGATSYTVTFDPIIPSGLSETNAVVSGTVTTPTGTAICTVVGANSFGKVTDSFQWTTLTTGDPTSGINVPINEA